MTADDLTRLRAVAEAATPGPWQIKCSAWDEVLDEHGDSVASRLPHPDAEFIATFDPPTVAALIDRVERAERERDKYRKHAETCRFGIELGDLRVGIRQLADEWDDAARDFADQAAEGMSGDRAARYYAVASKYEMHAQRVRALLTEGADDGQ